MKLYSGTPKCGHPEIKTPLEIRTLHSVPMQCKHVLFSPWNQDTAISPKSIPILRFHCRSMICHLSFMVFPTEDCKLVEGEVQFQFSFKQLLINGTVVIEQWELPMFSKFPQPTWKSLGTFIVPVCWLLIVGCSYGLGVAVTVVIVLGIIVFLLIVIFILVCVCCCFIPGCILHNIRKKKAYQSIN